MGLQDWALHFTHHRAAAGGTAIGRMTRELPDPALHSRLGAQRAADFGLADRTGTQIAQIGQMAQRVSPIGTVASHQGL
jgi:hypothetical protein